ncbi:MAG: hypothetical protein C0501_20275 [Isosphaera sp.]|nr:hypothetical protein [Isosphaera sp.]
MSSDPPATTPPTPPWADPPADPRPQYEFDDAQNRVIADLALAIVWVRLPLLVVGLLQAVIATGLVFRLKLDGAHVVAVLSHALAAVVAFLLAGWLGRAAEAFARITTTKGSDVTHLMTALRSLGSWFDLLAFFVKLYLALLALLIVLLLVGLLADAFRGPA